jgi:hypothetical protein
MLVANQNAAGVLRLIDWLDWSNYTNAIEEFSSTKKNIIGDILH